MSVSRTCKQAKDNQDISGLARTHPCPTTGIHLRFCPGSYTRSTPSDHSPDHARALGLLSRPLCALGLLARPLRARGLARPLRALGLLARPLRARDISPDHSVLGIYMCIVYGYMHVNVMAMQVLGIYRQTTPCSGYICASYTGICM